MQENRQSRKPSIYNPIKDYEKFVLTAINISTTAMNKASESELKEAIMAFVYEYGMLGLMTALPTTLDFITYEAVYLPKNHFIREENISTERYLSCFFPFDKIDFHKKGSESNWGTDSQETMTLIMSMKRMAAIGGVTPTYHIELRECPALVWNFNSLLLCIQMMFSFMLTDDDSSLKVCKHSGKAFTATRSNMEFCFPQCKNQYNVHKSRAKKNNIPTQEV